MWFGVVFYGCAPGPTEHALFVTSTEESRALGGVRRDIPRAAWSREQRRVNTIPYRSARDRRTCGSNVDVCPTDMIDDIFQNR